MTEQIKVPKQAWDAVVEALEKVHYEVINSGVNNYAQLVKDIAKAHDALAAANAVSHEKPETTPAPEGGAITSESAANAVSHPQATAPAGWKLVPVEPTQEMLDAVVTTVDDHLLGPDAEKQYREDWAAMLAAAPEAHHGK